MTREEAKEFLIFISYTLGNMGIEYLTEKDGGKMREAIKILEQESYDKYVYSTKDSYCQYDDIDKKEISKAVVLLDLFTKIYCRYQNDYKRFGDLKFRCNECPFQKENGNCLVKSFKNKYAPDYRNFGSMEDL